jgi:hypothetical protein
MKRSLWIVIGLIILVLASVLVFLKTHKRSYVRTTLHEVDADIRSHLLIGSPRDAVVAYLDQKGIGHTYVGESKESPEYNRTEIALIRDASYTWPVRTDIQIIFVFDGQDRLSQFSAGEIFTGP